ncbi:MAG: hypothetical protein NVSMB12_10580 [Acidimicrobiales bacterium]
MFVALALVCLRNWLRERARPDRWASAAFGVLGAVGLVSLFLPATVRHALGPDAALHWVYKVLVAMVLLFPYLLVRFLDALEPLSARHRHVANALMAVAVVYLFALPRILATTDHRRPWWLIAFVVVVFVQWGWLSAFACVRFMLAGRHQPNVVRRRMQILSLASLVLVLSLLPNLAANNNDASSFPHLVGEIIGILAGFFFYLGIAPPALLRMLWRRPEEHALRRAEVRLMTGATKKAVANAVLPHLPKLFGGGMALLTDRNGALIGAVGTTGPDQTAELTAMLADHDGEAARLARPGLIAIPLRNGVLAVEAGAYTPFFGREEADLLNTLAAFVDLALARAELFERERDARIGLELAHQELEDLVYSLSHDLKSPLISLLGYLDYLKIDCGEALGSTGEFYVERMTVSASYMTSLIEDLLTLSRIGRTQTEPEVVDVGAIVAEVVEATRTTATGIHFEVGDLPVIFVNGLRARELFTNLIDNALKHGGRPDLTVRIGSEPTRGGGVAIKVADNGVGIPEAYQEKVFGIFERLGTAGNAATTGTGIGLAMCRKIVEQDGGTITITAGGGPDAPESDAQRAGVTFRIEYPAAVVRTGASTRVPSHGASR